MRTKALLCVAGLLAAGAATSMAQNVYSLNVVGYITVNLTNQAPTRLTLVANQLDLDGTGANNTLLTFLGTNLPVNTIAYGMNSGVGNFSQSKWGGSTWFPAGPAAVVAGCQPGSGLVVALPSGSPSTNLTYVGNVMQGSFAKPVGLGFQMGSIMTPRNIRIATDAGYVPVTNATGSDTVFTWNKLAQSYVSHRWTGSTWFGGGGEPTPAIGESFIFKSVAAKTWTQNFTVQ